jgi:hypothetical protein
MITSPKAVVVNENILGLLSVDGRTVEILRRKGAPFSTYDDPLWLKDSDDVRQATRGDFTKFKVVYNNSWKVSD